MIYGLHAVRAALSNPRRVIRHAYFTANAAVKFAEMATARDIPSEIVAPSYFDTIAGGAVHQGALAVCEPLIQPQLDGFLSELAPSAVSNIAVLDQVTDPHNVGAVLRSAAAFGIGALIVQDRHSPPLSATLAKAASGALELVPIIAEVNLTRALIKLKDSGFRCLGFDSTAPELFSGGAVSTQRSAFVFGAEDRGLRRLLRETCDSIYAIRSGGSLSSLNISNAAAIVFYEAAKQRQG
jgi:23S rRNA (guanosine2251-2'-O)-methyltransferase